MPPLTAETRLEPNECKHGLGVGADTLLEFVKLLHHSPRRSMLPSLFPGLTQPCAYLTRQLRRCPFATSSPSSRRSLLQNQWPRPSVWCRSLSYPLPYSSLPFLPPSFLFPFHPMRVCSIVLYGATGVVNIYLGEESNLLRRPW